MDIEATAFIIQQNQRMERKNCDEICVLKFKVCPLKIHFGDDCYILFFKVHYYNCHFSTNSVSTKSIMEYHSHPLLEQFKSTGETLILLRKSNDFFLLSPTCCLWFLTSTFQSFLDKTTKQKEKIKFVDIFKAICQLCQNSFPKH